jgi:hypothetical protein
MTHIDLSRETYGIVAARRTQFDQLVWQVPVLSLTAQAFLFSIALSADATMPARRITCGLSFLMTLLCLYLMIKHRQAEVADSEWLAMYESQFTPSQPTLPWPMHGPAWSLYRAAVDPQIGRLGFISRWRNGFLVWFWGLALFGGSAVAVFAITFIRPGWLAS